MALQTSGQIKLSDVNVELGNSANAEISMGSTAVRTLFSVASGQIRLAANGYGASGSIYPALPSGYSVIFDSNETSASSFADYYYGTTIYNGQHSSDNFTVSSSGYVDVPSNARYLFVEKDSANITGVQASHSYILFIFTTNSGDYNCEIRSGRLSTEPSATAISTDESPFNFLFQTSDGDEISMSVTYQIYQSATWYSCNLGATLADRQAWWDDLLGTWIAGGAHVRICANPA